MEIKTPEQIADEFMDTLAYQAAPDSTVADMAQTIRGMVEDAIEADRAQRADALSALHEWAVSVSYSMSTDKSNDWSEEIDALVEIEQMYELVDTDGERTDN